MTSLPHSSSPCCGWLAGILLVVAACRDGSAPAGPAEPAEVRATSGGGQMAPVATVLPSPLVATVVDGSGNPVSGVPVTWRAEGSGRLEPEVSTSDREGRSEARWVLGEKAGVASALAAVPALPPARFAALAELPEQLPLGEIRLLDLETYDGSGQVVHPDYVRSAAGVFDQAHHLAITPYPHGNASYENPALYASPGRKDVWAVSAGAPNPLVRPTAGHLSDPDLVFVPESGELRLYYRQASGSNVVLLTRSDDGRTWSDPVEVARRPSHEIVSPTVVRRKSGEWYMWAVNSGSAGCGASSASVELRRSSDGVRWSEPVPLDFPLPELWPWHIDVQWVSSREEFWAVFNAKTATACTTPAVFIARSTDGVVWDVTGRPVITKGRIPEFEHIVYRSTFDFDPSADVVTLWYSGARYQGSGYVWRAAVERRHREELFAPSRPALDQSIYVPPPAPLEEWP
jgi:hypothetical protein